MKKLPRALDTASAALTACAGALGDDRDVPEIALASALAFRISADDQVTLAGPHAFPWREELARAAERLGYRVQLVASNERPGGALHQRAQAEAYALISSQADANRPTLLWGVHAPEFGIAVDLRAGAVAVSGILDGFAPDTIARESIGTGDVPLLFALALTEKIDAPASERVRSMLAAALEHGRGPAPTFSGVATGIAAWRNIFAALESGVVDPAGFSYTIARAAEARRAIAERLRAEGFPLEPARVAYGRSASMLTELSRLSPFPPTPATMLTSSLREESAALIAEVITAESQALDQIAHALVAESRSRSHALSVREATSAELPALFACTREIPVLEIEADAAECRARVAPAIGRGFRAKLIFDERGTRTIAQLLYAPLEHAHYPIAALGKRWLIFCPWVAHSERGRGLGAKLFAELEASARQENIDGLLALATSDERFLHGGAFEPFGMTEIARAADVRLYERRLSDIPSDAKFLAPLISESTSCEDPPFTIPPSARKGSLPVIVRQGYNCPLLLRTRRELVEAAKQSGSSVALDVADGSATSPIQATVSRRPLPHRYLPTAHLIEGLKAEIDSW